MNTSHAQIGRARSATVRGMAILIMLMLVAGTLAVAAAAGRLGRLGRPYVRNGAWIAYSTAPACAADGLCGEFVGGSAVFMIRAGGSRKLVADRTSGAPWNICPVFSPNGRMLAFAREKGWAAAVNSSAVVIVRLGAQGTILSGRRVVQGPEGEAPCPQWSADSSRVAYRYRGKVVVFGLDGKRRPRVSGDPTIHDFVSTARGTIGRKNEIVSPSGKLIAWQRPDDYGVVVSRPDGSHQRVIPAQGGEPPDETSYEIAGWSPDGRKLLLMYDVGGARISAVSLTPPFASKTIVDDIQTGNPRSWPGYGDVSWQPIPRRQASH
jgi:WD40-like Beta Propeller Repeat